jgi:hypothetical protein
MRSTYFTQKPNYPSIKNIISFTASESVSLYQRLWRNHSSYDYSTICVTAVALIHSLLEAVVIDPDKAVRLPEPARPGV